MICVDQKYRCCGCQACAQICPKACITMVQDDEGFLYPGVNETLCVQCGLCRKVCPVLRSKHEKGRTPIAYAAYNTNEAIRQESSSGGIFSLLADAVLSCAGIVYGAALDGTVVKHLRISRKEELPLLRGSKYVQSDINQSFLLARQDLEQGRRVLFTGTPCQIEGLLAFLQKSYDNLICMDIICHGVPSPKVWNSYVIMREKAAESRVNQISFRNKKDGWRNFSMYIRFSNSSEYISQSAKDPFMNAFLCDLCLRPSCYQCSFKKINRASDITVADFWGIEEVCPDMDDDRGISLVILQSEKGKSLFSSVCEQTVYQKVDIFNAIRSNSAMTNSSEIPKDRGAFMEELSEFNFEDRVSQYAKHHIKFSVIVKSFVKWLLNCCGLLMFAKKIKRKLERVRYTSN